MPWLRSRTNGTPSRRSDLTAHSTPTLDTARLRLRALTQKDSPFVYRLLSDPEVREFLGGPVPKDRHEHVFASYLSQGPGGSVWLVEARETAAPVGLVFLAPYHDPEDTTGPLELSYLFDPASWGQGHAGEALRAVLEQARRSHKSAPRIVAETRAANRRSRRLLIRLGFAPVRRYRRFGSMQVLYSASLRRAGRSPLWPGARVAIYLQSLGLPKRGGQNRER